MAEDIFIGIYDFGNRRINLYATPGLNGGSFTTTPDVAELRVGFRRGSSWPNVLSVLMHELVEFALGEVNAAFIPNPDFAQASDGYVFHASHAQFSEAIGRAGWAMAKILPTLATEYREWSRKDAGKPRKIKARKSKR